MTEFIDGFLLGILSGATWFAVGISIPLLNGYTEEELECSNIKNAIYVMIWPLALYKRLSKRYLENDQTHTL